VSKWELDETMPELPIIVQLSQFFGVTTDYLLKEGEEYEVEEIAESENYDWEVSENRGFFSRSRSLLRLMEILVTPIYLAIGLIFGIWHPTWVIFLLPWLIDELVNWFREKPEQN
ncbi:MAG: helix-turn-helix domain-containing protein, partial [Firmicutes bacterium]|nr:helix-turn-helix domain-containing protein [Bacillota bacterium]